jgi:hypothetical protein
MGQRQTCSECGENSPETETDYTLAGFGWRAVRGRTSQGLVLMQWRCPTCWRTYRESGEAPPPSSRSPSLAGPLDATSPAQETSAGELFVRATRHLRAVDDLTDDAVTHDEQTKPTPH